MKFVPTKIPGVVIVEPQVHRDARGFFVEVYHEPRYRAGGIPDSFVQDNHSRSSKGALRGLHGQSPHAQGKLVRAVEGEVWDVAVDVRRGSPTWGEFVAVELSAESFRQIYVPPGLLHGFCVLSEVAQIEYKCTEIYRAEDQLRVRWDDPDLAIPWPIRDPALSPEDAEAPRLREVEDRLLDFGGGS